MLLRIRATQKELLEFLVEQVVSYAQGHEGSDGNIALEILNHIRWCEVIYYPRVLLDLVMDSITAMPPALQIEWIVALPGLTADRDQAALVSHYLSVIRSVPGANSYASKCM